MQAMRLMRAPAAVVVAAAMATAVSWWFFWVPNFRPSLHAEESYGIDVSHHQGVIDWRRVAADDIAFAYIKATEGGDFIDTRFRENWEAAYGAGVPRGAYHFFTLCRSGFEQARNFLSVAVPDVEALPPAVDLELAGNCRRRPPGSVVSTELDAFLREVEARWGRPALLYVGDDWEALYPALDRSARHHWLVSFFGRPRGSWTVWQLHGYAHVDGVLGGVDLNVGRLRELRSQPAARSASAAATSPPRRTDQYDRSQGPQRHRRAHREGDLRRGGAAAAPHGGFGCRRR